MLRWDRHNGERALPAQTREGQPRVPAAGLRTRDPRTRAECLWCSSVSGQLGTKRNSSRAAVPQSQRMERDKRPQHPAFLAFKDLYTPFHTQLSQNTSWMLLQTQRSPGKCLISHTMIWIQALSQTQACWIFLPAQQSSKQAS